MANHLENGTYLLDETERQTYTVAARMLDRVDHHLDLEQPLADFDSRASRASTKRWRVSSANVLKSVGVTDEHRRQTQCTTYLRVCGETPDNLPLRS